MTTENHYDSLIVGQGLAGTLLAWALVERGQRVLVVDAEKAPSASRVAAGIVTPITGQRLVKTWRLETMAATATDCYRRIEAQLGATYFRKRTILRLLSGEVDVQRWSRRAGDADYENWLESSIAENVGELGLNDEFGAFEMRGWQLDVAAFLDASREWLAERGMYRQAELPTIAGAIDVSDRSAVTVPSLGVTVKAVVLCQGWKGSEHAWFDWVPFRSAKGEVIDVEMPGLDVGQRVINRGGWLLPLGGGRFRCGATYDWDRLDCDITEAGRADLEARLQAMLRPGAGTGFSVTAQAAAVRPVIRESKALLGRHPSAELERVAFLNGFGSKGVLNGPFFAEQLAAHLVEGAPIEAELDLRKNL